MRGFALSRRNKAVLSRFCLERRSVRRREFLAFSIAATIGRPFAALAQRADAPTIGFLHIADPVQDAYAVVAFRQGLKELGYIEGQNAAIEFRWAEGQYNRLTALGG